MKEVCALIQPTGDELCSGVVEDTDSPMIRRVLGGLGISATVAAPVPDGEHLIEAAILRAQREGFSLMVLIGGSGGGRKYDETLNWDLTHTAMDHLLSDGYAAALYGKNGHLWSRLVCGRLGEMTVVNVPGPYREAEAAIRALAGRWREDGLADGKALNLAMAGAVEATYGRDCIPKTMEERTV